MEVGIRSGGIGCAVAGGDDSGAAAVGHIQLRALGQRTGDRHRMVCTQIDVIAGLARVAADRRRTGDVHSAVLQNTAALVARAVAGNAAALQVQRAAVVDAAAVPVSGGIAADLAAGYRQCAVVVNAAAAAGCPVPGDGSAVHRQRAVVSDAAAVARVVAAGDAAVTQSVREGQRAAVDEDISVLLRVARCQATVKAAAVQVQCHRHVLRHRQGTVAGAGSQGLCQRHRTAKAERSLQLGPGGDGCAGVSAHDLVVCRFVRRLRLFRLIRCF